MTFLTKFVKKIMIEFECGKYWNTLDDESKQMLLWSHSFHKEINTPFELFCYRCINVMFPHKISSFIHETINSIFLFFDRTVGVLFLFDIKSDFCRTLSTKLYINRIRALTKSFIFSPRKTIEHYLYSLEFITKHKTESSAFFGTAYLYYLITLFEIKQKYNENGKINHILFDRIDIMKKYGIDYNEEEQTAKQLNACEWDTKYHLVKY